MKTYKCELVTMLAKEKVKSIKKDIESKGKTWDYGNEFQTKNTLVKTWENLYNTYPLFSKSMPIFSLSKLYDE